MVRNSNTAVKRKIIILWERDGRMWTKFTQLF